MEIIDYPNYLIYNDGRVYSKNKNKFLKPYISDGYHRIRLINNDGTKCFRVHRLVALHYIPLVEGKDQVDHIDRNKTNNHISNLRWANNSENMLNTDVQRNNILGHKNIRQKGNKYVFRLCRKNHKHSKTFETLDEAIEYRDEYLRVLGRQ